VGKTYVILDSVKYHTIHDMVYSNSNGHPALTEPDKEWMWRPRTTSYQLWPRQVL